MTFLPQVPGGYYVDRNLTNAFRRTVFYSRNYREALLEYNRETNWKLRVSAASSAWTERPRLANLSN